MAAVDAARQPASPDISPRRSMGPALAVVALLAAVAGALGGWLMPRGPVTTAQAVVTLVVCLSLGVAAGWLTRSRWVLLVAPLAFVTAYELLRLRVDGPTLGAPRLGDIYGVMALVVGRGVDALLTVLPMLVGAGWGLLLARRRTPPDRPGRVRRVLARGVLAVGSILVLALVAGLLRPASTPPVLGPEGTPEAGSIAELTTVEVGGHEQHLMIRGADASAPVLLFLEGGPGGSALGRMRRSSTDLEGWFVVVTWDQRGTGKSYPALEPTDTLTVDRMVEDTLEVVDHLRERFGQDRVYLVGSSWGSVLGVLAVQRRPEVFHAYVGTGQMADPHETDTLMYADNLAQARRTGDTSRVQRLEAMGPPPYTETLDYTAALAGNPEWYDIPYGADRDPASEYPMSFLASEYTLLEQLRGMGALAETYAVLYPQLADVDLRRDAVSLDVPVYLIQGEHEVDGRSVLAREWFELLDAPHKEWLDMGHAGHTPPYDDPGEFARLMGETVLAETLEQ